MWHSVYAIRKMAWVGVLGGFLLVINKNVECSIKYIHIYIYVWYGTALKSKWLKVNFEELLVLTVMRLSATFDTRRLASCFCRKATNLSQRTIKRCFRIWTKVKYYYIFCAGWTKIKGFLFFFFASNQRRSIASFYAGRCSIKLNLKRLKILGCYS